jgi:formylmethanofuran dehydrogenase subunit E
MTTRARVLLAWLPLLAACGSAPAPQPGSQPSAQPTSRPTSRPAGPASTDELLARVAAIHGAAGPFAVAGYRMGQAALRELGLEAGRFELLVVHASPAAVQWSCVADGLQAATGTSVGKLNLRWVETDGEVESRIGTRDGARTLVGRLRQGFLDRYLETPRERLLAAGREVAELPEAELFTLSPAPAAEGEGAGR